MRVPDQIRKCVAFIGWKPINDPFELMGTVFFLGGARAGRWMITARHVIDEFKKRLIDDVWLRLNTKAGKCEWVRTDGTAWLCPHDPSLDIAVHPGYPNDQADHMILDRELAVTPTICTATKRWHR
jgi:hypothetical protein